MALARSARAATAKKAAYKLDAKYIKKVLKPRCSTLPAKLTRPHAGALLARPRIFRSLEAAEASRWIWIGAPAGAGKTSLASSWIEARGRECLWVQLDAGDADPASFFHYLILAGLNRAGRKRVHPPALTPEYMPGLEVYARRFFEQLFGLYARPFVMVLDNFHEVPTKAPLSGVVMAALLDSLPTHGRVLCLSRTVPPSNLTRWSMQPGFKQLRLDELSLTDEEALELAKTTEPSAVQLATLCNRSVRGWVAGVKLLLRATPEEMHRLNFLEDVAAQGLFDYYAREVLERMPAERRDFLLHAALLPEMQANAVNALIEREDAETVLAQLYAERLFIERRMLPSGPSFQFHPLFRSYLLTQLACTFTVAQIAATRTRAAASLEAGGQLEAATMIALECDDPELLARLILAQAAQLVTQGRLSTLEHWLRAVPERVRAREGWLLYWLGVSLSARDPVLARSSLQQAYDKFCETQDIEGSWLAVASIVHNYFLAWGAHPEEMWHWVDVFESLRADNGGCLPESVEATIIDLLTDMVGHCPEHPLSGHLAARARALAPRLTQPEQRRGIGGVAVGYMVWQGDEAGAWMLIDELASQAGEVVIPTLATLSFDHWRGTLLWTGSEHERAFADLSSARECCRRAGLGIFECYFLFHLACCALSAGDSRRAEQSLRDCFQSMQPFHVHIHRITRALQAMQLALCGRLDAGVALARELRASDNMIDAASSAAFTRSFLTAALLEGGALDEAEQCGTEMLDLARRLPSDRWLFEGYMLLAGVELERGAQGAALEQLRSALRLASRRGFLGGVSLWQSARAAKLLALALRHHIESDYVRRLIRHRKIAPAHAIGIDALWPVRLRVATLGRFGIWIEDQPMRITKAAGRKPLEVLKALIGLGSADISLGTLGEQLWPELDGAAAHNACHVAIHRLRKMLGEESAIRIDHGLVALNWSDTWADAEAFRVLANQIRVTLVAGVRSPSELESLAGRILAAYPGHFLPGEERTWAVGVREQLRARFTHLTIELSVALESTGAHEAGLALNRHGIELDPLAEAFHRGVIRVLIALQRKAEALEAYRHCRVALLAGLHVQPSAETRALHAQIQQL